MSMLWRGYVQEGSGQSDTMQNVWKKLYSLKGEQIYLKQESMKFNKDIQPLIQRNRFFKVGQPYISKDISPEGKGDFLIANKPVYIHAMGILTKQTTYDDIVKKCIKLRYIKSEKLILIHNFIFLDFNF